MARRKQYHAAEEELMQVPQTSLREERLSSDAGGCPSRWELRQFAAGKCDSSQRDQLLGHLAVCDRCIDSMTCLRQRRWVIRTAFAFASVMVVIAAAALLWVNQHRAFPDLNRVATVDLRLISPTRGQAPGPQTATVRKAAGGLRVVLPVGSDGNYEVGILGQDRQPTPLLRSSGSTRLEDHDVVLNLPVNLSNLKGGKYWLGLRRDGSEWEYYSLSVE
jgi:hypothetical protein